MISKGSWVALATCSAESPIASNRCAVSVLVLCLPSGLKVQKLLAQGVWGKTIEKGSICHDERVTYRPFYLLYDGCPTTCWSQMYLKLIAGTDMLVSMLIVCGFTVGIDAVGKDVRLAAQLFRTVGLSVQLQQWREVDG